MTMQPELPLNEPLDDPEYVAACEEVIRTRAALEAAHAAWNAAMRHRAKFLIADGVLPVDE